MSTLTPDDRDRLRELAENATPGPWIPHPSYVWTSELGGIIQNWSEDANAAADMELIAAARTAVPALLDALQAAEHRATRAEKWAALWKETARRAIRGERVLFRVNRQTREQMERERGHLFRVAAERNDATERAEQLEKAEQERDQARAQVDRVRALHQHGGAMFGDGLEDHTPVCADCLEEWPCPTIRALDGEP